MNRVDISNFNRYKVYFDENILFETYKKDRT